VVDGEYVDGRRTNWNTSQVEQSGWQLATTLEAVGSVRRDRITRPVVGSSEPAEVTWATVTFEGR
jgi:hypothetical protein